MSNANLQLHCPLKQRLTPLLEVVWMGINKWHNADFLAVAVVVVTAKAVVMVVVVVVAAAAAAVAVAMLVVVVDAVPAAAAVPVELSLHSQVLTCLHICNSTATVNDKEKLYKRQTN
jgi:hypothetical protein